MYTYKHTYIPQAIVFQLASWNQLSLKLFVAAHQLPAATQQQELFAALVSAESMRIQLPQVLVEWQ
jgi:hypothetical protein